MHPNNTESLKTSSFFLKHEKESIFLFYFSFAKLSYKKKRNIETAFSRHQKGKQETENEINKQTNNSSSNDNNNKKQP